MITQGGSGKVLVVPWCPSSNGQSTPCSCSPPCPCSPGTKHAAARTAQRSIASGKIFQNVVGWDKCYSMESALNLGNLAVCRKVPLCGCFSFPWPWAKGPAEPLLPFTSIPAPVPAAEQCDAP